LYRGGQGYRGGGLSRTIGGYRHVETAFAALGFGDGKFRLNRLACSGTGAGLRLGGFGEAGIRVHFGLRRLCFDDACRRFRRVHQSCQTSIFHMPLKGFAHGNCERVVLLRWLSHIRPHPTLRGRPLIAKRRAAARILKFEG